MDADEGARVWEGEVVARCSWLGLSSEDVVVYSARLGFLRSCVREQFATSFDLRRRRGTLSPSSAHVASCSQLFEAQQGLRD